MGAFRLTWNLRGLGLLLWICWPALGTGAEVVDVRILFGVLAAITAVSAVSAQRATHLCSTTLARALDAVASAVFLAYFCGWLLWLFRALDSPPTVLEPVVIRTATGLGLLTVAVMSTGPVVHGHSYGRGRWTEGRVRGLRWGGLALTGLVWLADLPVLHQPLFLAAPNAMTHLPLVGAGAALIAVQFMVSAKVRSAG